MNKFSAFLTKVFDKSEEVDSDDEPKPLQSLASKALHVVGTLTIGSTGALNQPANFYWLPGDRMLPKGIDFESTAVTRTQLSVDHFRRALTQRVGFLAACGSLSICTVVLIVAGLFSSIPKIVH